MRPAQTPRWMRLRWLTEGVADYVARPHAPLPGSRALRPRCRPTPTWPIRGRSGRRPTTGPGCSRCSSPTPAEPPTLRALYQAACGDRHTDLPTAVHDVLGTDDAGILADWQQWLSPPAHALSAAASG